MPTLTGTFDVQRTPEPAYDLGGVAIGRNRFDKTFHGPLEATSVVHMLAVGTETPGSAAYVAVERITGTLLGRTGSFVVTHTATMNRGVPALAIAVVPDSGTGGLVGLTGTMEIEIVGGVHRYTLACAGVEEAG